MSSTNEGNVVGITTDIELFVSEHNKQVFCTSRQVAEKFDKEHKNVIRAIEGIETNAMLYRISIASGNQPHFKRAGYVDAKGETRPEYHMTRDGFSLLAMGFTGPEAFEWKVRFLESFNAMRP
jgi:Rha family phage regulatory protein